MFVPRVLFCFRAGTKEAVLARTPFRASPGLASSSSARAVCIGSSRFEVRTAVAAAVAVTDGGDGGGGSGGGGSLVGGVRCAVVGPLVGWWSVCFPPLLSP